MADTPVNALIDNIKVNIPDLGNLASISQIRQIDRTASKMLDQMPIVILKLGIGVAVIIAGWLLSGWVASKLNKLMVRARVEETLAAFLGSTARFVLFFTIFGASLTMMGIGSTSLAALLGAIGLAVGLAVKGTLGHVASGVMLMVHRPLKVGDWVENTTASGTASVSGTVKRIGLFSTEINTQEFVRVFVPNTMLWENILRNHTYNRMRMLKLSFSLGYEVDVRSAFGIVKAMLTSNPLVLRSPEPLVAVDSFGEGGVICLLHVWVRTEDRGALRNSILLDVMEILRKNGMRMAYQAVQESSAEGLDGASASLQKDAKIPSTVKNTEAKSPSKKG